MHGYPAYEYYPPPPPPRSGWRPEAQWAVGCGGGCAALVLVQFVVLWGILQVSFSPRAPRRLTATVKALTPAVAGRPFPVEVRVRNETLKPLEVREIHFRGDTGLTLRNPQPVPLKSGTAPGALVWTFNRTLAPAEALVFRLEAVSPKPGEVEGTLEIFAPEGERVSFKLAVKKVP